MRKIIDQWIYSFPVQLVFHHFKQNLSLLAIWALLIAAISGGIGKIYGIHYLYLDPEYVNKVGFWSFLLVGVAFGILTMAFHITCYILDGHRYAFVGILERPFAKFSLNNSVIPGVVLLLYVVLIVRFQLTNEFSSKWNLALNLLGLGLGVALMLILFFVYFKFTNKDIFKYLSGAVDKRLRMAPISRNRVMKRLKETRERGYRVRSFVDLQLRVRSCESLQDFYDKAAVLKVFDQNHFNSVVVELGIILTILLLGSFMDNPYFQIPAAASSLLMLSILVMLIGAVSYWFRGWGITFVIALFLVVNVLIKAGVIKSIFQARGLNYDTERATYSLEHLKRLNNAAHVAADRSEVEHILEHWKEKQQRPKPKAILLCVSGGGQRAALWTLNVLQHADSVLQGSLMDQTVLITGASGGMIGAAYYRELQCLKLDGGLVPSSQQQLDNIGKDNLNAIIFSLLVNDAFFRVRRVNHQGKRYVKDRGYVFEDNLNNNLGQVFTKRLSDYRAGEELAEIPMMLMAPVIANDGRKLYISTHGMSFMNVQADLDSLSTDYKIRGADFNQLFNQQGSDDLSFLTALRMSASFPYITPTITLPSDPPIEIMDAGIADNFGVGDASRFVYVFREWFEANTSGVVLVVVRDTRKSGPIEAQSNPTIIDRLTYPIASVYNNLGHIQDINNDIKIEEMKDWLGVPVETVEFEYNTYTNIQETYLLPSNELERKRLERASLSWHLTTREKRNIVENIQLENNQQALKKLWQLMK